MHLFKGTFQSYPSRIKKVYSIFLLYSTGLCAWVINIITFYNVWTFVEPKRKALAAANAELAAASQKLAELKAKIAVRLPGISYLERYCQFGFGVERRTWKFKRIMSKSYPISATKVDRYSYIFTISRYCNCNL
jgi:hypothetical protein